MMPERPRSTLRRLRRESTGEPVHRHVFNLRPAGQGRHDEPSQARVAQGKVVSAEHRKCKICGAWTKGGIIGWLAHVAKDH